MSVIDDLLRDVPLPRMARVRQRGEDDGLSNVAAAVRAELAKPTVAAALRPGMSIALGVGSRGLADLPLLVRTTVDALREAGADPFIVPAMGSHGRATAEGQTAVLAKLGVTEESAGALIRSSMEVVEIDRLPNGLPVLMDAEAMRADGIAMINRVKAHTSFSGPVESGLAKMLTIGLGKQKGADGCHRLGFGAMAANVVDMARIKIARTPVLFGLASLENARERIFHVEAVPAADILEREPELLAMAKSRMAKLPFNPLDALIVDEMGKEYSGTGTDPHVTGRAATPYLDPSQRVTKMAILRLSPASAGNAAGMGFADITTRQLFEAIDFDATYANHITSTVLSHARIPVIMPTDRRALQIAIKTCNAEPETARVIRIPNTLHLGELRISEALVDEARERPDLEVVGDSEAWAFEPDGRLSDLS